MKTAKADLIQACWQTLEARQAGASRFDIPHLAYYMGALIVMAAMGWFMNTAIERFGGRGLLGIATAYGVCFAAAGCWLSRKEAYRVPGGLLVTLAVWMTPLAMYGLERTTGFWVQGDPGAYSGYYAWIRGSWFPLEIGTIAAGLVALRFVRFPFLTFPVAFAFWFTSMDLAPLLLGRPHDAALYDWKGPLWVSVGVGLLMLVLSALIDRRTREDYAFWGYLFGLLAFWGGLPVLMTTEPSWAAYGLINVALMLIAVVLQRRVFLVFGAIGGYVYLGHLAYSVFKDSAMFPFALTALGLAIIYSGVVYQRHYGRIESYLHRALFGPSRGPGADSATT